MFVLSLSTMKGHLIQLFEYDLWANRLMYECICQNGIEDDKIIFWINHIVNAEHVWLERIRTGTSTVSPTRVQSLEACGELMQHLNRQILDMLAVATEESLLEEITYSNTRGMSFRNVVKDILTHVVNHSTHHRAQIAARLREMEIPPPPTDFIFFMRQVKMQAE